MLNLKKTGVEVMPLVVLQSLSVLGGKTETTLLYRRDKFTIVVI
jgi:hypothetical protein